MKICYAASEMAPFIKTGGLGDVLGALPEAMQKQGNDIKVFLPHYKTIDIGDNKIIPVEINSEIKINDQNYPLKINKIRFKKSNMEVYLVGSDHYFDREGIYLNPNTGKDYADNDERYIFFARAVLAILKEINFKPDIIHVHDWQAALVPVFLKTSLEKDPFYSGIKSILTIHNLAYQGEFTLERFKLLELPDKLMAPAIGPFEFYGKVNFLKAGITYADYISTVSNKYAEEIQTKEFGCGLEGVLKERNENIYGILNGVDYKVWSPSRDHKIHATYHIANLSGKRTNKIELLNELKLPIRDAAPLIGIISRLEEQKGWNLIKEAADELLSMNVQLIVVGTGQLEYHKLLEDLEKKYPDKCKAILKFNDQMAHKVEAASDIFLMPSIFEPCGLNQMYSLRYGTIPIVRQVGGLADTVTDYDANHNNGTGFVFKEKDSKAMVAAIKRAVDLFARKRTWTKFMKVGMKKDFSWSRTAKEYSKLYKNLLNS